MFQCFIYFHCLPMKPSHKNLHLHQGPEWVVWISNHGLNFRSFSNHVTLWSYFTNVVISRITWKGDERTLTDQVRQWFLVVTGLKYARVGLKNNNPSMLRKQKVWWLNWQFSVFCLTTAKLSGNEYYCYKIEGQLCFTFTWLNFEPSSRHSHLFYQ